MLHKTAIKLSRYDIMSVLEAGPGIDQFWYNSFLAV